ncbi:MAG: Lsr2 family protein [Pseudonocardiaceae bacterium]
MALLTVHHPTALRPVRAGLMLLPVRVSDRVPGVVGVKLPSIDRQERVVARKVITTLVCDVTGAEAAETINFGIDGKMYEIDLAENHAGILRDILGDYVEVARRAGKLTTTSTGSRRSAAVSGERARRPDLSEVRAWARQEGYSVSARGRVSAEVLTAFDERSKLAAVG